MPEESMKEKNRLHQYDKIKPFFTDDTDDLRYNLYIDLICEVFYDSKVTINKIMSIIDLSNKQKVKLQTIFNPLSYNSNYTLNKTIIENIFNNLRIKNDPATAGFFSTTKTDIYYDIDNDKNWYIIYFYKTKNILITSKEISTLSIGSDTDYLLIHPEWIGFFVNMMKKFNEISSSTEKKISVLKNIKETTNLFYQELIKKYVTKIEKNDPLKTDIKDKPKDWFNAFDFIYNTNYNIISNNIMSLVNMIIERIDDSNKWSSCTSLDNIKYFYKYIGIDSKKFTYNLEKLAFSTFFEEARDIDVEDDDLGNFFDAEINDRYTRDPKTFKLHDNELNRNVETSVELLREIKDTKCYGTGIGIDDNDNEIGTFKCEEFIINCLHGDSKSIEKCKEYMMNTDYFKNASKEINNMLPFMALKILDAFKVARVSLFDSRVNSVLLKYESLGEWQKRITDMVPNPDAATINSIKANGPLNHYIKLLIEKVNSNPAILNQKYSGTKYDQCTYNPEKFKDTYFYNLGLRARTGMLTNFNKSEVLRTVSAVTNSLALLPTKFNFRRNFISPTGFFPIRVGGIIGGGGVIGGGELIGGVDTKYNMYKANFDVLKRSFDYLEKVLESRDKSISEGNKRTIYKFFESYRTNEKKLIQILNYIHRYNEIDRMFGVYDNKKILNMSDFKKIVDAYGKQGNKFIKKNDDLPSLFTQLLSAVEGDLTD